MISRRVHGEWRNRVTAEYCSAAITAQAVHWMIQAAFPEELVLVGLRIVGDELAHARLSYDTLVALGGADEPNVLDANALGMRPSPDGLLASLVDTVVRNFCLGETFAVPLFNEMRRLTHHEAARPVLTRVLQDESIHRQFGWDALDELITRDPDGVRGRITAHLPSWLEDFRRAYGTINGSSPLTEDERAAGLMNIEDYVRIHQETLADTILPRFAERGITLSSG